MPIDSLPFVTFVLAFALSAAVTPLMKRLAPRIGIVAIPSVDRWHGQVVPLLGGVAIWSACTSAALATAQLQSVIVPLVAGAVMFVLGLADDVWRLKPATKLIGQVMTACALVPLTGGMYWSGWPAVDALITILWFVGLTNSFNLLDNMDGLCAGIAAVAAVALWAGNSSGPGAPVSAAVGGACLGFLLYNFHPASIFMGDSGSLFIGGVLATLTIGAERVSSVSALSTLAFPVILMLIPIFDTSLVTVARKLSMRPASAGGRDHASHRLVALGFPERTAVLLLYGLAALAGAAAVAVRRTSMAEAALLLAALVIGLVVFGTRMVRVNVYGGDDFQLLRNRRYTPLLVEFTYRRRTLEILLDLVLMITAYYGAYAIRFDQELRAYQQQFVTSLPIVLFCQMASFLLAGVYRGFWRYITVSDLTVYAKALLAGPIMSVLAIVYLYRFEGYSRSVFIINGLLLALLILAMRFSFRMLGEVAWRYQSSGKTTLIYGAGDAGVLLLRELRGRSGYGCRVTGFLDDERAKWGRIVSGVPVLGGASDLAALLRKADARVVILSTELTPFALQRVASACRESGVELLRFDLRLQPLDIEATPDVSPVDIRA